MVRRVPLPADLPHQTWNPSDRIFCISSSEASCYFACDEGKMMLSDTAGPEGDALLRIP